MPPITGDVDFNDVTAEYKTGEPVLKDVSFTAEPGQTIAIVGPTGAGKTTIINLIPRFYDVTGGSVPIDGIDVRDVTPGQPAPADRHRAAGHLPVQHHGDGQHPLWPARCDRRRSDRRGQTGARRHLHRALADGYQTVLGERGSGLSQGQRQLLAIARAALANPRILILDEATRSVDTRTERQIQQALESCWTAAPASSSPTA